MARDRDYSDILNEVKEKKVSIWTCTTCARLCFGFGGDDAAQKLADKLREDGVTVTNIGATSAGCIMSKVRKRFEEDDADIVIALTCGIGARCVSEVSGKETISPVEILGAGFQNEEGVPMIVSMEGGYKETPLSDIISPDQAPFV